MKATFLCDIIYVNMKLEVLKLIDDKTEIMFIDIAPEISNHFKSENLIINTGSLGCPYVIEERNNRFPVECGLNHKIEYLPEQDIVFINTNVKKEAGKNPLIDKQWESSRDCTFIADESDKIFFSPFVSGAIYNKEITDLLYAGKVVIIFSSQLESCKISLMKYTDKQITKIVDDDESNYSIIFGPSWKEEVKVKEKGRKIKLEDDSFLTSIFAGCTNDVFHYVHFPVWKSSNTFPICRDEYDNVIAYLKQYDFGDNNGILIILPQFKNLIMPIYNILYNFLPEIKPELLPGFVKNTWMDSEEYLIPEIKSLKMDIQELQDDYQQRLNALQELIIKKKDEYSFLIDILSSDGHGKKLEKDIKKVLELVGFNNVIEMDKKLENENPQEDLQIVSGSEIMLIEVKGHNGMPSEDDCQALLKYINRNMRKHRNKEIFGVLVVNHNKAIEPVKRICPAFSKEQIRDAERDQYCLVSTWELYQAVRLFQTGLLSFNDINTELHTAGLFQAIPRSWKNIGKIDRLYKSNEIACLILTIEELKIGDEIVVVSGNDYFVQVIDEMQVNSEPRELVVNNEPVSIKMIKPILKSASIYIK